jgi:HK97 gp10 family phage protein
MAISIKLEGIGAVEQALKQLEQDIGDKQAKSKVLVPAVREAFGPVLTSAKSLAPKDTGALSKTLQVEARRPTRRDRRSKYVSPTDTVIAAVTTKPFPKKLRQEFYAKNSELLLHDKKLFAKKFKEYAKSIGFPYDARAIAQEVGSAHNAAHPFLRPALENNATNVVQKLSTILARRISEYRMKK